MAYMISQGDSIPYGVNTYVVDADTDVAALPLEDSAVGSMFCNRELICFYA